MKTPTPPTPRDPQTPAEWQAAADAATFYLTLDSARQYGLLTGGPKVNAERCIELVQGAKARGIEAKPIKELCRLYL